MTVTLSSPYTIGLVAGTGVTTYGPVVPSITTDNIFNPNAPTQTLTQMLAGISTHKLIGSAVIDATTTANIPVFSVPVGQVLIPTAVIFALSNISGSGNPPAINCGYTAPNYLDYIDSQSNTQYSALSGTPFVAGTGYVPSDTLTLVGGTHSGSAVTLTVTDTKLVSTAVNAVGTGYAPNDTITLAGGTATTRAVVTVNTTKLVSASLNAAGTYYAPTDTVTLAGGTAGTAAVITVSTCKLISATIGAGGTGYGNTTTFNVTVAGGTGTSSVVNVTTNSGGIVTTVNSITTAGSYTVLPTASGNLATGDDGTDHGSGLTLNLVFGINTFTISTAGSYTVNSATFTQASTTGSGSGVTLNNGLFGVNTITVTGFGDYTANTSSFTQQSSSGAGIGATFNTALFGVDAVIIAGGGQYSVLPTNHCAVTGGSGTGATIDMAWSVATSAFSTITTIGQLLQFDELSTTAQSSTSYSFLKSGNQLTLQVAFAATYPTYKLMAYVFGFVTATPAS